MNMKYLELSDEELLRAIKAAREVVSTRDDVSFEVAVKSACDSIVEEKEASRREVAAMFDGEPQVEEVRTPVAEMFEVQQEEHQEEQQQQQQEQQDEFISTEDAVNNIYNNLDLKDENRKDLAEIIRKSGAQDVYYLTNYIQLANQGRIVDEEEYKSDLLLDRIDPQYRKEFVDKLLKLNELERENDYSYYAHSSLEALEADRLLAIREYEDLKASATVNKRDLEIDHKFNANDASTITFERLSTYNAPKGMISTGGIGDSYINDPGKYHPSPNAYDDVYGAGLSYLLSERDRQSKRIFEEGEKAIDERIEMLKNMTPEQFRNYKLAQMRITEEEKIKFDNNIRNNNRKQQEEIGRSM